MHRHPKLIELAGTLLVGTVLATAARGAELPEAVKDALASSKYVYIASSRKNGTLSKPAEIWFLYRNGAVYVGTPPTTWRARRIKAGHTAAKIWVGKPDGPSFMATGALVNEPDVYPVMFETYAKKYPDGWAQFEQKFRQGSKDGNRVLIKYTPKDG